MSANRKTLLCRYHYDPLDRLADCTPSAQAHTQRFYLKERLTSEIQGSVQRSIFQQDDQLLAQQQRQDGVIETTLLATDQQRSVLHALDATQPHPLAYTPYGHGPAENGLLSLLGFNGERPDPVTGHYLLGNGYRAFNPVLMRFNSPDSLSPFGEGGLNAYAYCIGDPINRNDPTGHFFRSLFKGFANRFLGRVQRHVQRTPNRAPPPQVFEPAPAAKSHTAPIKSSVPDNLSSTSETAYELGSVSDHLVPASETGYDFHSLSDVTVYTIETFKAEAARAFRIRAETNAVNERIRRGSLTEFPPSPAEPRTESSPINVQEWVNTTRTTRSSRHTRIN